MVATYDKPMLHLTGEFRAPFFILQNGPEPISIFRVFPVLVIARVTVIFRKARWRDRSIPALSFRSGFDRLTTVGKRDTT